ncbi:hypothetical protein C2G38_2187864 [Gigaspora rosea]|uniref:Uncharacterized protein n=1 Tax=Gigaspora rosea TaxID=44941 RepID=A0A397V3W7_9GLOM|nr:hypothetical protein C2G38_2187864 [Gigaspora rosea]
MSFFKKFINKLNKQNTFTSEETFIETWKENQNSRKVVEEDFWGCDIQSSCSTNLKADSEITTLRFDEEENQIFFDEIKTSTYSKLFNLFNDGYSYYIQYKTLDLMEHRRKSYENDFKVWFQNVNLYYEEFRVKYIWSYSDLEKYCNEHLSY